MTSCKNCFSPIKDLRRETRCTTCNAPLHKDCAIKDGGTFCDVCYTVKEESNNMATTELVIPDVIRRSYVELYKSCPYAFYLEVIKGIPSSPSSFAKIGIDLHDLFHKACLGEIATSDEMKNIYTTIYKEYEDDLFYHDLKLYKDITINELREKLFLKASNAIDTFFHILKELPHQAFALEENIIFGVGEDLPKISITMDRLDNVDGMLDVCDWKTGSVIIGKKISTDLQAPLYIKAIQEHYNKPVRKFTFYYLSENKIRTFERIDDENYVCRVNKREYFINLTDAIREVQRIFSHIKKGEFNIPRETKKMYFTCKTCYYQLQEICQGADVESWKQYTQGGN